MSATDPDSEPSVPMPVEVIVHHEAAHAVIHYRAGGHASARVTVLPDKRAESLGHAVDMSTDSMNREDVEARIMSCYAGGHAQRRCDPSLGEMHCRGDDENADELLLEWGWEGREQEFRDRSQALVEQHWVEI